MSKKESQAKFLATSSVSQNILGMFNIDNHVNTPDALQYGFKALRGLQWQCENNIGQIFVSNMILTQAHKDILEVLFMNFPAEYDEAKEEYFITFSFDKLLRRMGKQSNPQHYIWLLNAFNNMLLSTITMNLFDLRKTDSKGRAYFEGESFHILNAIAINGKNYVITPNNPPEKLIASNPEFFNARLEFSRQYSKLMQRDVLLRYESLVDEILKLPYGHMKALVRHCYGHEWRKGIALEDILKLYIGFHPTNEPKTVANKLAQIRKVYKLNEDSTESKWITHLRKVFGIKLSWNNKRLFVDWSKKEFDEVVQSTTDLTTKVKRISQWKDVQKPVIKVEETNTQLKKRREIPKFKRPLEERLSFKPNLPKVNTQPLNTDKYMTTKVTSIEIGEFD